MPFPEPCLKTGHIVSLVNSYWLILGVQRVCSPQDLPVFLLGHCLRLPSRQAVPAVPQSLHVLDMLGGGLLSGPQPQAASLSCCCACHREASPPSFSRQQQLPFLQPSPHRDNRMGLKENEFILSIDVTPVTSTQHCEPIFAPVSLSSETDVVILKH